MNLQERALVDVAYDILSERYDSGNKEPMPFNELVAEIGVRKNIDENKLLDIASAIYTALTLDGRFVIKSGNTWFLKEHELYKYIHIDMNDAYESYDEENTTKRKRDDLDDDDEDSEEGEDSEEENEDDLEDADGSDEENESNPNMDEDPSEYDE